MLERFLSRAVQNYIRMSPTQKREKAISLYGSMMKIHGQIVERKLASGIEADDITFNELVCLYNIALVVEDIRVMYPGSFRQPVLSIEEIERGIIEMEEMMRSDPFLLVNTPNTFQA